MSHAVGGLGGKVQGSGVVLGVLKTKKPDPELMRQIRDCINRCDDDAIREQLAKHAGNIVDGITMARLAEQQALGLMAVHTPPASKGTTGCEI